MLCINGDILHTSRRSESWWNILYKGHLSALGLYTQRLVPEKQNLWPEIFRSSYRILSSSVKVLVLYLVVPASNFDGHTTSLLCVPISLYIKGQNLREEESFHKQLDEKPVISWIT